MLQITQFEDGVSRIDIGADDSLFIERQKMNLIKKKKSNVAPVAAAISLPLLAILMIAILVGVNLFQASNTASNRDAVVADLNNIAANAQMYYKKPASLGGGGNSFVGFEIPTEMASNENGNYSILKSGSEHSIVLLGKGVETGDDGNSLLSFIATINVYQINISRKN